MGEAGAGGRPVILLPPLLRYRCCWLQQPRARDPTLLPAPRCPLIGSAGAGAGASGIAGDHFHSIRSDDDAMNKYERLLGRKMK